MQEYKGDDTRNFYDKNSYIETVTNQIRCKRARTMVAEELLQHIEDQTEACQADGMAGAEAEAEAVRQMGDPIEAGVQLDRVHRPKLDVKLILIVAVLSLVGLGVKYTVSSSDQTSWFLTEILYTELGILAMVLIYFADYTLIGKYALPLWCGWTGFLFLGMNTGIDALFGNLFRTVNGQYRIYALVILLVPLYAGLLYRFRGSGYGGLGFCGLAAAVNLFLTWNIPSRTAMMELLVIFASMLTWAVKKGWFRVKKINGYLMIYGPIAAVISLLLGASSWLASKGGYAFARMDAALHPEKYAKGWGFIALQLGKTVKEAKWIGESGFDVLMDAPELTSDYIFTYVIGSYGILAGILLLAALCSLIVKAFANAFHQKNQLGAMIGFGCAGLFLIQTLVYVSYNLGYTLFTPTYLPFFSKAGAGTVSLYILLGLMLSVYRNTNLIKEKSVKAMPRYRLKLERIA